MDFSVSSPKVVGMVWYTYKAILDCTWYTAKLGDYVLRPFTGTRKNTQKLMTANGTGKKLPIRGGVVGFVMG